MGCPAARPRAFNYHDLEKARGCGAKNLPEPPAAERSSDCPEDRAGNSYGDSYGAREKCHGGAFSGGVAGNKGLSSRFAFCANCAYIDGQLARKSIDGEGRSRSQDQGRVSRFRSLGADQHAAWRVSGRRSRSGQISASPQQHRQFESARFHQRRNLQHRCAASDAGAPERAQSASDHVRIRSCAAA